MIDAQTKVRLIKKLEDKKQFQNLKIFDIHIWPLIRLHFAKISNFQNKNQKKILSTKKNYLKLLNFLFKNFFQKTKIVDVFAYSRSEDNITDEDNNYYDKNLDSVIKKFRTESQSIEKYILYNNNSNELPNIEEVYHFSLLTYSTINYILFRLSILFKLNIRKFKKEILFLNKFLDKNFKIDTNDMYKDLTIIYFYSKLFQKILKKKKPKLVIVSCYYNLIGFSLIHAANKLNIPSVDVQHGICEPVHIMYNNWNYIPKKGYNIIPNFFMSWGEKTADSINFYFNNSPHKAVIGGKLDLNQYKFDKNKSIIIKKLKKIIGKDKKIILFTCSLKNIPENFYQSIIELSKKNNCFFLIRFHPLHSFSYSEKLINNLKKNKINCFDYEITSKANIYDLLSISDFHFTGDSTVAYEALNFNIKSIIIEKEGKIFFSDYISKKIFIYTENFNEIVSIINNNINFKLDKNDRREYYITNKVVNLSELFDLNER